MRALVDFITLAMLLALLGGVAWHQRAQSRERETIAGVREDVRRIERELRRRAATGDIEVNGRGWPTTIDPGWFTDEAPINRLLPVDRPWLEIAPPEHADLVHPLVRQSYDRTVAAFWYNPALGVVRARVPVTLSDRHATELYNTINGVSLSSIFEGLPAPPRRAEPDHVADADDMSEGALDPTRPRDER